MGVVVDQENKNSDKTLDVMTAERLRAHLYGGRQVPFWNYDPDQITMGIEVEYFIAETEGESFTLATKQQYLIVIQRLVESYGYKDRNLVNQPGRISRDTEWGFITIKPDFAWHILEISFPPRRTTVELRSLLVSVIMEVDAVLAEEGLKRLDLSCLPEVPKEMDLVELDRLAASTDMMRTVAANGPMFDPLFPAYLTSTHVHLNVSNETCLGLFPILYSMEPIALNLFSRARRFAGESFDNVRTLLCEDNLGEDYRLRTVPKKIPSTLDDLVLAMNQSTKLFPNDPFFAARDMSYIRPTRYGTLEFRSACSYLDVDQLIRIALWRKAQILCAYLAIDRHALVSETLSESLKSVCKGEDDFGLGDMVGSFMGQFKRFVESA